jgi:hypothetical protein
MISALGEAPLRRCLPDNHTMPAAKPITPITLPVLDHVGLSVRVAVR